MAANEKSKTASPLPSIKKIKFKYVKKEDYAPVFISGVVGSLSPKGEIVAHFFTEMNDVPDIQVFESSEIGVNGELQLGNELLNERTPKIVDNHSVMITRNVMGGIIMNLNEARSIHDWLGKQIAGALQNIEKSVHFLPQNGWLYVVPCSSSSTAA